MSDPLEVMSCPPRPVRVAIALESEGNRRLLVDFLSQACEEWIIASPEDVESLAYDVCFVDGLMLERLRHAIERKQAADAPLITPHILVTPRHDVGLLTREMWRVVDDIVVTPIEPLELAARFAAAWRARSLSLECYERALERTEAVRRLEERVAAFRRQMRAFAHDMRNPVNVILGFERLIASEMAGPITEEQRTQLAMMEEAGSALLRIAESVAMLAQSGETVWASRTAQVDVGELVTRVCDPFRRLATGRGLAFTVDATPGLLASTDAGLFERVIENLVSNAVKYTERGSVAVRVRRGPLDTIVVEVSDTGTGISEEDQKHLFEEGFRVAATAAEHEGLGLGLSLVRDYVHALGGSVQCLSALGEGSTFTVTLPLSDQIA